MYMYMGLSFKEKVKVYVSKAQWLGGLSVKVRVLDNEKKNEKVILHFISLMSHQATQKNSSKEAAPYSVVRPNFLCHL